MGIENLVKITTIVRDQADVATVRAGRATVLGTHRPASTLIVGGLSNPAWKVEVEGVAVAWRSGRVMDAYSATPARRCIRRLGG
jgi:2-iminobutanoate/2-iminopropanoate deaminase